MVKMVLMDFYSRRKQAWKESRLTILSWGITISTYIKLEVRDISDKGELSMVVINLIQLMFLLAVANIHIMYQNYLPAAMCLVPFNYKEKKEYLWTALWVKVGITSGVHLLWNVALVIMGALVWWKAALLVLCLIMFNVQQGIRFQNPALSEEKNMQKQSVAEMFLCLFSLVNYSLLVISCFKANVFTNTPLFWGLMGISLVIQVCCAICCFSKCEQRIEAGVTVEDLWKKRK